MIRPTLPRRSPSASAAGRAALPVPTLLLAVLLLVAGPLIAACDAAGPSTAADAGAAPAESGSRDEGGGGKPALTEVPEGLAVATFAGGCFWCMEPPFDKVEGVKSTTSGYTGGSEVRPTYEQVSYGRTSHAEAVRILYDPQQVSYERLLDVFWRNIDPTVADRQFCDRGHQYRTAVYFHDAEQERLARETKQRIEETAGLPGPVVTEIEAAGPFYPAEDYHQDFYEKSPVRYKSYRAGCGRDARLRELWGDAAGVGEMAAGGE